MHLLLCRKALCLYWALVVVSNSTNLHFRWLTPLDMVELEPISVAIMRAIWRVSELWGAILCRNIALSINPQAWPYCFICLQPCGHEGHLMFASLSFLLVHMRPWVPLACRALMASIPNGLKQRYNNFFLLKTGNYTLTTKDYITYICSLRENK